MRTMMKRLISLVVLFTLSVVASAAPNYSKITYIHPDGLGNPAAASDEQGNLEWRIEYYPYGAEFSNSEVRREADISFAGKAHDEEIGLSYFGGRWYDPDLGRFTGIDPMPVNAEDWRTFNRYSYGFNNPYRYIDPDGNMSVPAVLATAAAVIVKYSHKIKGAYKTVKKRLGKNSSKNTSDATKGADKFTKEVVKRGKAGSDGGKSQHVIEKINGKTTSTTHQVTKNGKTIHQHQDHVGKYGTVKRFSDKLTGTKTINASKTKDTMAGGRLGSKPKSN